GGFPIVEGAFVTVEDGTGIVHIAPPFGEDDYNVAAANDLFDPSASDPSNVTARGTLYNPVNPDGTFDKRVAGFEGAFVKAPAVTERLIAALRERTDMHPRGLIYRERDYEHSYPHCWRCDTPLLYYAKSSWYV